MNSKTNFWGIASTRDMVLAALVAALYVVMTTVLAPFSFGVVQVRLSEMFNHMVTFNKRYVVAVTLGVFIANIIASPFGVIDIVVGTLQTFLALLTMRWLNRYATSLVGKFIINTLVACFFMFMIAAEIALVAKTNFWPTFWANWGTIALGELISMTVGGGVIGFLSLLIDFKK